MTAYQRFEAVLPHPSGRSVGLARTLTINNVTYEVPRFLIPVTDNLAVMPNLEAAGSNITIRLDQWTVGQLDPAVVLPVALRTAAAAIQLGRDFDRDPSVSFRSAPRALEDWVRQWLASH